MAFTDSLSGVKVLIADDDADNRELLYEVLRRAGAVVTTAASGQEALDKVKSAAPDVLVSDLAMPELDGCELLRRVRALHPGVPAVALTAHGGAQDADRAITAGFDRHLTKPVIPDVVVATVATVARAASRR